MAQGERIEDLLESVADAVSALVMFSTESVENKRMMTNIASGSKILKEATNFLVDSASKTTTAWNNIGSPEMAAKMQEAGGLIAKATQTIIDSAHELSVDFFKQSAKQAILDAGKDILKGTVRLQQFYELYEIVVILRQIEICRIKLTYAREDTFAVEEFASILFVLIRMLERRVLRVHDTKIKDMLEQSAVEIEKTIDPLRQNVQTKPQDNKTKQLRESIITALQAALKKAEEATKLSAKSPFDLSLLDSQVNRGEVFEEEVIASQRGLEDQIEALKKAVMGGDEHEVDKVLRGLRKEIEDQLEAAEENAKGIADPALRAKLLGSVDLLKKKLRDMLDRVGDAARESARTGNLQLLEPMLAELMNASAAVLTPRARNNVLQHAANIEDLLDELGSAAAKGNGKGAIDAAKGLKAELLEMSELGKILAQNVDDDPFRKKRLMEAAAELADLGDMLANAAEVLAKKGASPELLKKLGEMINRVKGAMKNLINAASLTTPQEMLENASEINKELDTLKTNANDPKKNAQAIVKGVGRVGARVKPQVAVANAYAEHINDPEQKKNITEAAQQLQQSASELALAAKGAIGGASEEARKKLLAAIQKLRDANDRLLNSVTDSPDEEMMSLKAQIADGIERVHAAVAAGDVKSAAAALSDLKDSVKKQVYLARLVAGGIDDLELRKKLLDACLALDSGILDNLLPALRIAMENPNDTAAIKKLDDLLGIIDKNTSALVTLSKEVSPEDSLAQNAKKMNKTIDRAYQAILKPSAPDATAALKEAREQLAKHKQLIQLAVERTTDPKHADALNNAMAQLESDFQNVVLAAKEKLTNPATPDSKVTAAVDAFKKQATLTGQLALKLKQVRAEAEEAERLRRLKEEEEMKNKDEVYAAAHTVEKVVQRIQLEFPHDGSPAGMLAKAASEIARAMKLLSEIAKTGNKNELIMNARDIANYIAEVVKWANKCAEECSDPLLARELRDAASVAKNYSVQLKILCAVKAGMDADDPTAKKSLVICAQGLAKAVVNCVNTSQLAKLKKKLI